MCQTLRGVGGKQMGGGQNMWSDKAKKEELSWFVSLCQRNACDCINNSSCCCVLLSIVSSLSGPHQLTIHCSFRHRQQKKHCRQDISALTVTVVSTGSFCRSEFRLLQVGQVVIV